ncbi:hypothetical protein, partial [Bacillus sp. WP8]|uniref:hypothetical protein n=1 Tax=Bacillus sp. WP8 TaxID=756828 RepID=UPI001C93093F
NGFRDWGRGILWMWCGILDGRGDGGLCRWVEISNVGLKRLEGMEKGGRECLWWKKKWDRCNEVRILMWEWMGEGWCWVDDGEMMRRNDV